MNRASLQAFSQPAIEIPSEEDFREAMELLVLQGRNFDP
jgi:hypothetical protein